MFNDLDQTTIKQLFDYDGKNLLWKKTGKNIRKNKIAGWLSKQGYIRISISGKRYPAHRLIWIMFNGDIPEGKEIDHKNHIRNDNRIDNFRLASHKENCKNRAFSPKNSSGVTGVYWNKNRKKWHTQIKVNREMIYLGSFKNKQEAISVRKEAEIKYGFYKNHGK